MRRKLTDVVFRRVWLVVDDVLVIVCWSLVLHILLLELFWLLLQVLGLVLEVLRLMLEVLRLVLEVLGLLTVVSMSLSEIHCLSWLIWHIVAVTVSEIVRAGGIQRFIILLLIHATFVDDKWILRLLCFIFSLADVLYRNINNFVHGFVSVS